MRCYFCYFGFVLLRDFAQRTLNIASSISNSLSYHYIMDSLLCLLCGESLSYGETQNKIVEGMKNLIEASIQRKDALFDTLTNLSSVAVHTACRKNYTRKSSITAAMKTSASQATVTSSSQTLPTLRSSLAPFNFKTACLFCGNDADSKTARKRPLHKRDVVHQVMTEKMFADDPVLNNAAMRGETLYVRVLTVSLI